MAPIYSCESLLGNISVILFRYQRELSEREDTLPPPAAGDKPPSAELTFPLVRS